MLSVAVATIALEWTMGSEALFEAWPPDATVLPRLAFIVAIWGVACGRWSLLPFAVATGSLVLQTHLS